MTLTIHLGVLTGHICDLSKVEHDTARKLIQANENCIASGEGLVYGQLTALGHIQYQMIEKSWTSYGFPNERFMLKRR